MNDPWDKHEIGLFVGMIGAWALANAVFWWLA
jgi:hypothetical protein